jgi:hypothetical protein
MIPCTLVVRPEMYQAICRDPRITVKIPPQNYEVASLCGISIEQNSFIPAFNGEGEQVLGRWRNFDGTWGDWVTLERSPE